MGRRHFWGGLGVALLSLGANAGSLRVVSYNLHGHHPYLEAERYLESRAGGPPERAPPHLFYFTRDELRRGSSLRDRRLGQDLRELKPDLLLLQEVVAGWGEANKDCTTFYRGHSAWGVAEQWGVSLDLAAACRGNLGWFTDAQTFRSQRVVKRSDGGWRVVHDFGANPYPSGLVVEGLAIMARHPWILRNNLAVRVAPGVPGEKFFFQASELLRSDKGRNPYWYLVLNLHGPHKLAHFEVAVAVREWMQRHLARHPEISRFKGVVVGGDFNARIDEVSMRPWFEPSPEEVSFKQELLDLNEDPHYKPWARVSPFSWAVSRIENAFERWKAMLPARWIFLEDALSLARAGGRCDIRGARGLPAVCDRPGGIDHILTSSALSLRNSFVLYPDTSFESSLDQLSDHPATVADFITD